MTYFNVIYWIHWSDLDTLKHTHVACEWHTQWTAKHSHSWSVCQTKGSLHWLFEKTSPSSKKIPAVFCIKMNYFQMFKIEIQVIWWQFFLSQWLYISQKTKISQCHFFPVLCSPIYCWQSTAHNVWCGLSVAGKAYQSFCSRCSNKLFL